ncbi:MAG TPA: type II toxin-antitoxin system HicA family toxin [Planctomycetota bacterium]|jgi:predicted RNA binding protein YcfA (HicA-like mRNA interferase family)|nr:type II toxin-antitoxin system HicA family toxin [Planctomycetota bacterium]
MGTPVPVVSGREAAKAFERLGWILLRQRGSHRIYGKPDIPANLSIPDHRELARGTLRALIRTAEITVEEFVEALQK